MHLRDQCCNSPRSVAHWQSLTSNGSSGQSAEASHLPFLAKRRFDGLLARLLSLHGLAKRPHKRCFPFLAIFVTNMVSSATHAQAAFSGV